jgi:hypothetical protein
MRQRRGLRCQGSEHSRPTSITRANEQGTPGLATEAYHIHCKEGSWCRKECGVGCNEIEGRKGRWEGAAVLVHRNELGKPNDDVHEAVSIDTVAGVSEVEETVTASNNDLKWESNLDEGSPSCAGVVGTRSPLLRTQQQ